MRAILVLLEIVFWLLVARLVIRTLARLFGGGPARSRPAGHRSAAPPRQVEDLVLDRVCRTHVPRSRALAARIAGDTEYFCSEECRDKAKSEVARAS
jgi:YHS domain-containing protein